MGRGVDQSSVASQANRDDLCRSGSFGRSTMDQKRTMKDGMTDILVFLGLCSRRTEEYVRNIIGSVS